MKIITKAEYASTTYYDVVVEMKDGREFSVTAIVCWDNNSAYADHEYNINKDVEVPKNKEEEAKIIEFVKKNF